MKKLVYISCLLLSFGVSSLTYSKSNMSGCDESLLLGEYLSNRATEKFWGANDNFNAAVQEAKEIVPEVTPICELVVNAIMEFDHTSDVFMRSSQMYTRAVTSCGDDTKKGQAQALITQNYDKSLLATSNASELKEFYYANCIDGITYFDAHWLINMHLKYL